MEAETSSLLRRIFDQAFNQGNLAIVDEVVSVDVNSHLASWGMPASRLGLKQWIASIRTAFPDLSCTVEGEIGEGDKFAAHWMMARHTPGYVLWEPAYRQAGRGAGDHLRPHRERLDR